MAPDSLNPDPTGGPDQYASVAEFYDCVTPHKARPDIDFWVEMARHAGGPVLEVGCGSGRVLIPTANAGIEIVGLDLSPHMLALCRQKICRELPDVQARVQLFEADMRNFDLGQQFHLATTPFRSFQHLMTVDDQLSCLACIHRHLVEGGRLVLDIFNPRLERLVDDHYLEELEEEPEFTMPDGRRVIRRHRIASRDLFRQVQDVELIYYVNYGQGRQERFVHAFPMRYLWRFEAEHLLARCGFIAEAVYADFDRSPYGSKYPGELIFVARKV